MARTLGADVTTTPPMTDLAQPPVGLASDRTRSPFCLDRHVPSGTVRLHLTGILDDLALPALRAALRRAARHAGDRLVLLDLTEVADVTPAAVRVLMAAEANRRALRGRTRVLGVGERVDAILRRTDPTGRLEILDPLPPTPAGVGVAVGHPTASIVSVHGTVCPWMVSRAQHAIRAAHADGLGVVALDLGAATVDAGEPTVRLCALLRQLAAAQVPLLVRRTTPLVGLALGICARDVVERP